MNWYATIKRYYDKGFYTLNQMRIFVEARKITEEQYEEITGEKYIAGDEIEQYLISFLLEGIMERIIEYFKFIIAALGTSLTWLFGTWDIVLIVLVAFMVLDYVTGLIKAFVNRKVSSDV